MKINDIEYYSVLDAVKEINISFHKLYDWIKSGDVKASMQNLRSTKKCVAIDEFEIARLKQLLNPPKDAFTARQFAKQNKLSTVTVNHYINRLSLQPVLKHDNHKISPQANYYDIHELNKIHTELFNGNKAVIRYKLTVNTKQVYDPKVDVTVSKLQTLLDNRYPLGRRMIVDWIDHGYLEQHYKVDINGRIFFTPEDVQWIQARYKNKSADLTYNNRQLATKLDTFPSYLTDFRKFYNLPVVKVLGYQGVFYTQDVADKMIDWYTHPEHRPYPYRRK